MKVVKDKKVLEERNITQAARYVVHLHTKIQTQIGYNVFHNSNELHLTYLHVFTSSFTSLFTYLFLRLFLFFLFYFFVSLLMNVP